MIKGFHHIAFKSSHFKTSIAFYEGLGLIKKIMWGDREKTICMLDMGDGGCLELFSNGSEESPNGRFNHLAFLSDDVEGDFQRALSLGAKPHIYPKVVDLDSHPEKRSIQVAFVLGPDEEQVEFFRFV